METPVQTTGRQSTLLSVVLIAIIIALGSYTYLTLQKAHNLSGIQASITVIGEGEVLARPDIATFSFGVRAEADDAATAQEESAIAINDITEYLKSEGIDEKDIKTLSYNLNPQYDYVRLPCTREGFCPPGEQVLKGYQVHQTIQVKVRDIDSAGTLISGVGTLGATNVSSLQFTIDDESKLLEEARAEAIADAKQKARELAKELDVRLVRVTDFYEEGRGGLPIAFQTRSFAVEEMAMDAAVAPSIPTGENIFGSMVHITYEVK